MLALGAWGFKAMGEPRDEQIITPDSMTMSLRTAFQAQVAADLPATDYAAHVGAAGLLIRVDGTTLEVTRGDGPATWLSPQVRGSAGSSRASSPRAARSRRAWSRCCAAAALLDRFASTFHLAV